MDRHRRVAQHRRTDARMLDTAEGVLVAVRRCSIDDAFQEIVQVAKQHQVPALSIARALVELAENADTLNAGTLDADTEPTRTATAVAHREWTPLFTTTHTAADH